MAERIDRWDEGVAAAKAGKLPQDCPYAEGWNRVRWIDGFDSATGDPSVNIHAQGFRAAQAGLGEDICPYTAGTPSGELWLEGYHDFTARGRVKLDGIEGVMARPAGLPGGGA